MMANGVFMLVAPSAWYLAFPGVTSSGPLDQYFPRDIGLVFLLLGGALLLGAVRPRFRVLLWSAVSIWPFGLALIRLRELAAGICSPSIIPRDFPAVSLAAIIAALLALWAIGPSRGGALKAA
jgi:hypothetical protein